MLSAPLVDLTTLEDPDSWRLVNRWFEPKTGSKLKYCSFGTLVMLWEVALMPQQFFI